MFTLEDLPEPLNINFVLAWLCWVKADKIHFLNLEYFTMVYLPDDSRFRDHHQVLINLHIDDTVDSLDGRFLGEIIGGDFANFPTILIGEWSNLWQLYISTT